MQKSHAILSSVKHSLKWIITATSGITNLPKFVVTASVDKVEFGHFDSIKREFEPKQEWTRKLFKEKPELFQLGLQSCLYDQHFFKAYLDVFKERLNQTEGSHILQRIGGCEWDDESDEVKGFQQYGYDGEDFISLDLQTETWIAPKTQAVVIKHLWDADKERIKHIQHMLMSECPKSLQDHMLYGRSFLQRTESPSVSFLQKTPSSPVCCHATGFYPDRADLFWRKDGEEIHEGVEKGQILPNHDGTFQMSSELNVSLIKHEDWRRYDCVFQLSGLTEDIVSMLDKTQIQTNWVSPSEFPVGPVVGGAAGVVLLLVISGVLCCCWRNRNGEKQGNHTQSFQILFDSDLCKETQKHYR
uniref:Ig-like domain-containing protein n=1 Tax=Oryzias latipes TaxID=8090 RepID=H2MWX4_ORYLA